MKHYEYLGMSYEQASREGARLIEEARRTGNWLTLPENLIKLRDIMQMHLRASIIPADAVVLP